LPVGHSTRRELLAVLKEGAWPTPPRDVVNLFQNLISEGSITTRSRAVDIASDFASTAMGMVQEAAAKGMKFDEIQGYSDQDLEVEHEDWGDVGCTFEYPEGIGYEAKGFLDWPSIVKQALPDTAARGNVKAIAVRLAGSGAWLKYLSLPAMTEDIEEDLPTELERLHGEVQERGEEDTSANVHDEYHEDVDVEFKIFYDEVPDVSVDLKPTRRGIEWVAYASFEFLELEPESASGGYLTDEGRRQRRQDEYESYLEYKWEVEQDR
jgi:hypothetical protein